MTTRTRKPALHHRACSTPSGTHAPPPTSFTPHEPSWLSQSDGFDCFSLAPGDTIEPWNLSQWQEEPQVQLLDDCLDSTCMPAPSFLPTPSTSNLNASSITPAIHRQSSKDDPQEMPPTPAPSASATPRVPAAQPSGSQRPHYAVERRYRSNLNEKYSLLARALSQDKTQRICKMHSREWAIAKEIEALGQRPNSTLPDQQQQQNARQGKTVTLSVAIETISLLERCCRSRAEDVQMLRQVVQELQGRAHQALEYSAQPRSI